MRNHLNLIFVLLVCLMASLNLDGQKNRYLQINLNGGISKPIQGFGKQEMFAGRGVNFSGGFDYFFGKVGISVAGGYFRNPSSAFFSDFISNRYLEKFTYGSDEAWTTKYGLIGPVLKLGKSKFELDIYARGGFRQIASPYLYFDKVFGDNVYNIYQFQGSSNDWQFAWNAGTRFIYKMNSWLGIQLNAEYFTTSFSNNISYQNIYRDAADINRNGFIEDPEYLASNKLNNKGNADLNVINFTGGLVFQIGRNTNKKPKEMLPSSEINQPMEEVNQPLEEEAPLINAHEAPLANEEINKPLDELPKYNDEIGKPATEINQPIEETKAVVVNTPKVEEKKVEIPVPTQIPAVIPPTQPNVNNVTKQEVVIAEPIAIPAMTFDAPESKYDEEAAEFLYKAGESYFATNDFENALPCFNKLKADPKYPRSKYMFAMSLCAMGNCSEARKEYREFSRSYKGEDARTLEIIFASHFERCKTKGPLASKPTQKEPVNESLTTAPSKSVSIEQGKVYKIQFVAMKKSNADFPKVAHIGDVSTEFYPNKSVYRYTLGGYTDLKSAANDVYKVRKMGFRDAFIAIYDNGERINTIYHAK